MDLKVNRQFYDCLNSEKSIIIHEGGSGSSKTYSILQYLFYLCLLGEATIRDMFGKYPLKISIVRKYLPSLRRSVYYDFISILKSYNYYDVKFHNQSPDNLTYELNGNLIEFFAAGEHAERLRGPRRDILYVNEALEFGAEDWRQLVMRTNIKIIADYNPSETEHFMYTIADGEDSDLFVSTYMDNHFLSNNARNEIEKTKASNPEFWRVFGEGKRAKILKGRIYSNWERVDKLPEGEVFYGLDFGWHPDPIALTKCVRANDSIYIQELMYSTKVMVEDVIANLRMHPKGKIYCDQNQEQTREELRRAGFNALPAKKGSGSVLDGINFVKNTQVYVVGESKNLWDEYNGYKWKMKKGFDPDDDNAWEAVPDPSNADHLLDSLRYAYYSHYFSGKEFFVV